MIEIYVKSGTIKGKSAISFILKSQKHKWIKAFCVNKNLPENSFTKSIALDSVAVICSLRHIKNKYKKKKVTVYSDSSHVLSALKTKGDEYVNKTKISAIENLRDLTSTFHNISIKKLPDKCEHRDELEHIFIECALDDIELNEKS